MARLRTLPRPADPQAVPLGADPQAILLRLEREALRCQEVFSQARRRLRGALFDYDDARKEHARAVRELEAARQRAREEQA